MGLGAVLGSLGGMFGLDLIGQNQQNQWNAGQQHASQDYQERMWQKNYEMQKEFAQNGLTWKIQDAARSGISPLAALGAQGYSASPISVMSGAAQGDFSTYHNLGQNISRAVSAMKTPEEKEAIRLDLERKRKENDLLGVQYQNAVNELNKHAMPPGIPHSYQLMREPDGSLSMQPSSEFSQANAGNLFTPLSWWLRNKLLPTVFGKRLTGQPTYIDLGGKRYESMYGTGRYYVGPGAGPTTLKIEGR